MYQLRQHTLHGLLEFGSTAYHNCPGNSTLLSCLNQLRDIPNAALPHTNFKVRQGANLKVVVFRGLSWVLAVVRSESQVFVSNAANF